MSKHPLMKLRNFSENRDKSSDAYKKTLQYPLQIMIKYDGRHTTIHKRADGSVKYYTSSGIEFELLDDQVFGEAETPIGVYFAEMMGEGIEGKLGDRVHSGCQTNMVSQTKKGLFNKHKPVWKIFDYVTMADFEVGKCEMPFIERWNFLLDKVPSSSLAFAMQCENFEHVQMFMNKAVNNGWEGVVMYHCGMEWIGKATRRHEAVKWKLRPTADLLVVDELEGEGKYHGLIGSLRLHDAEGNHVCDVGSGLTDEMRALWGNFTGKIVEVEFEQVMDSKLIQPVFKHIRDDKTKAEKVEI